MKKNRILQLTMVPSLLFITQVSLAAPLKKSSGSGSFGSSKSSGRDWVFTLPIMAERPQLRLHAEYNFAGVGIAAEAAAISSVEELSQEEVLETGNSLQINGLQASLLMSRYTDEANLGGFFWSVGAGYRQWGAEWKKKPEATEALRLGLVDQDGYLHHRLSGKGMTGHLRGGYRYVASSWPIAIGAHIGIRHMNSRLKDSEVSDQEQQKMQLRYSDLSTEEKLSLKHKMMTTPDITIDFGLAF